MLGVDHSNFSWMGRLHIPQDPNLYIVVQCNKCIPSILYRNLTKPMANFCLSTILICQASFGISLSV